jgi:hypothetical protein
MRPSYIHVYIHTHTHIHIYIYMHTYIYYIILYMGAGPPADQRNAVIVMSAGAAIAGMSFLFLSAGQFFFSSFFSSYAVIVMSAAIAGVSVCLCVCVYNSL